MSLDNALIAALVERWRRETNTLFTLTVGELKITLEDVALLLGLAVDGEPVIGPISAPSAGYFLHSPCPYKEATEPVRS
jgi:hypothetical protein